MKKLLSLALACLMTVGIAAGFSSCGTNKGNDAETTGTSSGGDIIVQTNAFFAPFEYYDGTDIVGVDVDIMNLVGKNLGRGVKFDNVDFSTIIDNVSSGKVCDAGAAGITITDERAAKVDFSTPYYTSVQYVIYAADNNDIATVDGKYITWEALSEYKIGTQLDTTGYLFTDGEITEGVLAGTNASMTPFDNAQLAVDAIGANQIDAVIIDKLPAEYITGKNTDYKCLPLYYKGTDGGEDSPAEEQYAICVTKGNTELLNAINSVLADLTKQGDDGKSEIDNLVMRYMGLST